MHFLSHTLTLDTPGYGSQGQIAITKEKSIERGDSSESFTITMSNHFGTHVDCPAHFFKHGLKVAELKAESWCFQSPQVINVELKPGELMSVGVIKNKIKKNTDLLLFKSNWSKVRGKEKYSSANPGIGSSVGHFLRSKYPKVRAIGFDWISLSSYLNRPEGREAHRVFLDPDGKGHPIMIVEDMDLSKATNRLKQVFVFPLRVEGIDSAPCTVVGKFSDD